VSNKDLSCIELPFVKNYSAILNIGTGRQITPNFAEKTQNMPGPGWPLLSPAPLCLSRAQTDHLANLYTVRLHCFQSTWQFCLVELGGFIDRGKLGMDPLGEHNVIRRMINIVPLIFISRTVYQRVRCRIRAAGSF
jgi:hypothetical protein